MLFGRCRRAGRLAAPCRPRRGESRPAAGSPYGLQLAGSWDAARASWVEAGCPYQAALCLADAGDEAGLRLALEELLVLEARPAAAIVARRLRDRGVMSVPRGPRATTRQNQYGLTARELEVLVLVNEGLQNGQIADRLVVSVRTVDHHVEAILRKLGAKTAPTPGSPPPRSGWLRPPRELGADREGDRPCRQCPGSR